MMVSSFGVASIKGYYVFIVIALLKKSMRPNFAASRSTSVFFKKRCAGRITFGAVQLDVHQKDGLGVLLGRLNGCFCR
jgi:hypothetical protein